MIDEILKIYYNLFKGSGKMDKLLLFLIAFVLVYLFYLFFVILNKKKMAKFQENVYFNFLVKLYKLDTSRISLKAFAHIISLANAFIIATAFTLVCLVESIILKVLLAFAVLIPLQLIVYSMLGKLLQRKYKR